MCAGAVFHTSADLCRDSASWCRTRAGFTNNNLTHSHSHLQANSPNVHVHGLKLENMERPGHKDHQSTQRGSKPGGSNGGLIQCCYRAAACGESSEEKSCCCSVWWIMHWSSGVREDKEVLGGGWCTSWPDTPDRSRSGWFNASVWMFS